MGTPRFTFGSCTDSVEATKQQEKVVIKSKYFSNQCKSFCFLAKGISDQGEVYA